MIGHFQAVAILAPAGISVSVGVAVYIVTRYAIGLGARMSLACSAGGFLIAAMTVEHLLAGPGS